MSGMKVPIGLWGLGMCAFGLVDLLAYGNEAPETPALLFGVGGFMVALALVLALSGLDRSRALRAHPLPDVSPPTTFTALGFVLMALAAAFGLWLVWIGGGVVLVGLGGIAKELRAQRRALRCAAEREDGR